MILLIIINCCAANELKLQVIYIKFEAFSINIANGILINHDEELNHFLRINRINI